MSGRPLLVGSLGGARDSGCVVSAAEQGEPSMGDQVPGPAPFAGAAGCSCGVRAPTSAADRGCCRSGDPGQRRSRLSVLGAARRGAAAGRVAWLAVDETDNDLQACWFVVLGALTIGDPCRDVRKHGYRGPPPGSLIGEAHREPLSRRGYSTGSQRVLHWQPVGRNRRGPHRDSSTLRPDSATTGTG